MTRLKDIAYAKKDWKQAIKSLQ